MKNKTTFSAIAFLMACLALASCSMGKGDQRNRNLKHAVLSRLDSIPGVEYVGTSDVHDLDDNRLSAVILYYVADSTSNKIEQNARVTTNYDCSVVYSWEDLDSSILGDTKQMVSDNLKRKGIDFDDSLIDALIELKRR